MTTTTTDARTVIASNVRALLGRRKLSQTRLAVALGKSQAAVSRRLNGELPFDTDELLIICEELSVPLSKLIEGIEADDDGTPVIHGRSGSVQLGMFAPAA